MNILKNINRYNINKVIKDNKNKTPSSIVLKDNNQINFVINAKD